MGRLGTTLKRGIRHRQWIATHLTHGTGSAYLPSEPERCLTQRPVLLLTPTAMRFSSSVKGRAANLLLLAFSAALVLVGTEFALTLFFPTKYLAAPTQALSDVFKTILHQPSTVPGLSFELSPNRQKKYKGIWIRTNSLGMRDTEKLPIASDAVSRIVVLGDSFTFGYRVSGDSSYPSVLEQKLNQGAIETRFEVLNLGVCGYNTRDQAIVLEHKGLPWRPDLVVLGYVLNDPETDPVQPLTRYFHEPALWERSNLARLAAKAWRDLNVRQWGQGDYYQYLHAQGHPKWESVVAAFEDIRELTENRQIPVLVVIFPEKPDRRWQKYSYAGIHNQVAETARAKGLAVVDLLEAFSQYPARTMRVRFGDPHPSPQAHAVAAGAIYDWIADQLPEIESSVPLVGTQFLTWQGSLPTARRSNHPPSREPERQQPARHQTPPARPWRSSSTDRV